MEDTHVVKHHYIYSFRWDAQANNETLNHMIQGFTEYGIIYWIGKHEVSDKGKPHYQMAVWSEHKLDNATKDKVRKRFNRTPLRLKTAQPVSFVEGRKIQSLIAYVTKDKGKAIVQLPEQNLKLLPRWKNKSAEKVIFQDKLREFMINLTQDDMDTPYAHTDVKESVDKIVQFHIDHDIQPPSKGRMLYYLVKYHFISVSDYRAEVYNFKMFHEMNY